MWDQRLVPVAAQDLERSVIWISLGPGQKDKAEQRMTYLEQEAPNSQPRPNRSTPAHERASRKKGRITSTTPAAARNLE